MISRMLRTQPRQTMSACLTRNRPVQTGAALSCEADSKPGLHLAGNTPCTLISTVLNLLEWRCPFTMMRAQPGSSPTMSSHSALELPEAGRAPVAERRLTVGRAAHAHQGLLAPCRPTGLASAKLHLLAAMQNGRSVPVLARQSVGCMQRKETQQFSERTAC